MAFQVNKSYFDQDKNMVFLFLENDNVVSTRLFAFLKLPPISMSKEVALIEWEFTKTPVALFQ